MKTDKPFREFWLEEVQTSDDQYYGVHRTKPPSDYPVCVFIHVIEFSAVEQLEQELKEYKDQAPEDYLTPYENELLTKNKRLEKRVKELEAESKKRFDNFQFVKTQHDLEVDKNKRLQQKLTAAEEEYKKLHEKYSEDVDYLTEKLAATEAELKAERSKASLTFSLDEAHKLKDKLTAAEARIKELEQSCGNSQFNLGLEKRLHSKTENMRGNACHEIHQLEQKLAAQEQEISELKNLFLLDIKDVENWLFAEHGIITTQFRHIKEHLTKRTNR